VGGGAVIEKLDDTPSREDTFTGGGPDPQNNAPTSGSEDREFTVTPEDQASAVKVDVSWDTPEDYDIEVFRKNADGSLTSVGTSGNEPGIPEEVILTGDKAAPGTYVLRVTNFAAVAGTWTAKIGRYRTTRTVTTGTTEPYTMTCEIGGQVVRSSQLTIARGQSLSVDPCGTGASAKPRPKPKPKPKKASCMAKAKRKHGKARARAVRQCKAKAQANARKKAAARKRKRTQG